ncbi:hypothetical protein ABB37_08692 [Leptomonas pyrrhocoris]|uniref:Uncharacterized protein n=1 Tax=Leptomonas pyrrhocoris TaxID=157538 RepID=A0A0N0VDJ3_LEPPY|nr:hypothetical protein ABB37_08692 [Leptomonas pyrrhocoris]KPA75424.1 hypothetical protein ABB37_08692 [Leptomonas pyrrhocoris]|eukprot:XP_015653863.1 hypothetical protein ABB37_08692 [Leptomonas pyrrhocoris]
MSSSANMQGVQWPPSLLLVVRRHLEHVEDAVAPSIPPMPSSSPSIYEFFESHRDALEGEMRTCSYDPTVTECCIAFLIGVLEQACALSFLLSRERRIIAMTVRQVEKRLSKSRTAAPETKRRRLDEAAATESRYARVLTLEYLLRLYVSLPMILEHYDKLGSAAMPGYATAPLWCFINISLRLLSSNNRLFSPITSYVPLR